MKLKANRFFCKQCRKTMGKVAACLAHLCRDLRRQLAVFALTPFLAFDFNYGLDNTNILIYDRDTYSSDYNRLRLENVFEHSEISGLFAKVIVDNENRYSYQQESMTNKSSIYRAYLEYAGAKHFFVLGRQRVPFGVGRIWNPVDVYNPIDSFSIEPDERKGTEALRYEYAISSLSNLDITVSKEKSAVRIKGFLNYADLALVGVADSDEDLDLIGYEAAGELMETKIELRSEGGSFHDRNSGENHTEFIVGADYGFVNSLTILGEYKYSDETKTGYFGTSLSYQPAMLITLGLLNIINLDDGSAFTAPYFEYSLSDEMTLRAGALIYCGDAADEFGTQADSYYLNWFVHF